MRKALLEGDVRSVSQPLCTPPWDCPIHRVRHGYRNTRGDRVTGSAGTGTVLDFDTPRHTVTRTCGIAGTHGYFIMG